MIDIEKIYKEDEFIFSIGTSIGNSVYRNTGIRTPQDYSLDEFEELMLGHEVPTGEVEDGYEVCEFMMDDEES